MLVTLCQDFREARSTMRAGYGGVLLKGFETSLKYALWMVVEGAQHLLRLHRFAVGVIWMGYFEYFPSSINIT